MKIGYARVSTGGQSVAAQVDELTEAGAEKVFRETVSGAVTHRRQLKRTLDALSEGDVLLVTRLDRLARSTPRPAQHSGAGRGQEGAFPLPRRQLGRHHHRMAD